MPQGGTMQAHSRIPKLSRATFCLIADTIKHADICSADRERLTADFCSVLRQTNQNFKAQRFIDACQPERINGGSRVVRHA
jgi:hypothetical protein